MIPCELYLSTGAFTGRVNNRNPHLLTRFHDRIRCDGFELMLMDTVDDAALREYLAEGIRIPILHGHKHLGDLLSTPGEAAFGEAMALVRSDCESALTLGAHRLVIHGWGVPDSDRDFPAVRERVLAAVALGRELAVDVTVENCVCAVGSPLAHVTELAEQDPDVSLLVDTRCSEFHRELAETAASPLWRTNIRHVHINDYVGGYKDWDARYPIYQPGQGQIDWNCFFEGLRRADYRGSVTLEAPSMQPDRVDDETLNRGLDFIRAHLKEA